MRTRTPKHAASALLEAAGLFQMARGGYYYLDTYLRTFQLINGCVGSYAPVETDKNKPATNTGIYFDAYHTFLLNYKYDKKCKHVHLFVDKTKPSFLYQRKSLMLDLQKKT